MYVYHYFGNKYTDNVETGIVYALLCVHCDWLFDPIVSALYPVSVCVLRLPSNVSYEVKQNYWKWSKQPGRGGGGWEVFNGGISDFDCMDQWSAVLIANQQNLILHEWWYVMCAQKMLGHLCINRIDPQ